MSHTSETKEQAFEALIEKALVGSTIEERKAQGITAKDVDAQQPAADQYYWGVPGDFKYKQNEDWAIDMRRLMSFLHATHKTYSTLTWEEHPWSVPSPNVSART